MDAADVAIVGAGAAGLAAARDPAGTGLRVVVFEARDRVGGRIETLRPPGFEVPVELGAEFVHGAAPETARIARAAGLPLLAIPDMHWQAARGGWQPRDFRETIARVLSRVPARGVPALAARARAGRPPAGPRLRRGVSRRAARRDQRALDRARPRGSAAGRQPAVPDPRGAGPSRRVARGGVRSRPDVHPDGEPGRANR